MLLVLFFGMAGQFACTPPVDGLAMREVVMGTAVAGFQVDMGCPTEPAETCEDRNSDWYQWVTSEEITNNKGLFSSGDPVSYGPGMWELYEQDFKRAKEELGIKTFRMSIEWSRIFPKTTEGTEGYEALKAMADAKAIERYHKMFQALRAQGIEPLVTIHHYSMPLWIHDGVSCHKDIKNCKDKGWADADRLIPEIAKFAGFVAQEYAGEVDRWITLNEPLAIVLPGYLQPTQTRTNPPGLSFQFDIAKKVIAGLIEAHAKIYDAIKSKDDKDADGDGKNSYIGIAYNITPFKPKDPSKKVDVDGAKNANYLVNQVFLNAICTGKLDVALDGKTVDRPDLNRLDFLGINFYGAVTVPGVVGSLYPDFSNLLTFNPLEFNQEIVAPKVLYETLLEYQASCGRPIMITENGIEMRTEEDQKQMVGYLVRHLFWIQRANLEGAKVEAYHYWSLMDNYEWNHGLNLKFGLYAVDPKDAQKKRVARPGVGAFKQIVDNGGIPRAMLIEHLTEEEKALIPDILK
ncbi:MAG: glycoside hydrolase family 1 protein [Myxococcales bacterium]|nr:glycoside hydrolase family 1 protein [Myxococcales bacterium]